MVCCSEQNGKASYSYSIRKEDLDSKSNKKEILCLRIRIVYKQVVLVYGETVWGIQGLMEGHSQQEDLNTLQPHFHDIYKEQSLLQCLISLHLFQMSTACHSPYSFFKNGGGGGGGDDSPSLSHDTNSILLSCFFSLYIYLPHSKTSSPSVSLQPQCIFFPSLLAPFCLLSLQLSPFLSHPVFQEGGKA